MSSPELGIECPFGRALEICIEQVERGKGAERHGLGRAFVQQHWLSNTCINGLGFLTGQSQKKWVEANEKFAADGARYTDEVAGAIVYSLMAILVIEDEALLNCEFSPEQIATSGGEWLAKAWPKKQPRTRPATLVYPSPVRMRDGDLRVSSQNMVLHMADALCRRLEKMEPKK